MATKFERHCRSRFWFKGRDERIWGFRSRMIVFELRSLSLPYYKISPKFLFSSDLATNFRIRLYLRSASDHFTTDSLISCVSTPSCVKKRYPHHTNSTRTYELLWAFPAVFSTSRTVRDGYGEALSNAHIWAFLVWRSFPHAQQTPTHQSLEPHCE